MLSTRTSPAGCLSVFRLCDGAVFNICRQFAGYECHIIFQQCVFYCCCCFLNLTTEFGQRGCLLFLSPKPAQFAQQTEFWTTCQAALVQIPQCCLFIYLRQKFESHPDVVFRCHFLKITCLVLYVVCPEINPVKLTCGSKLSLAISSAVYQIHRHANITTVVQQNYAYRNKRTQFQQACRC